MIEDLDPLRRILQRGFRFYPQSNNLVLYYEEHNTTQTGVEQEANGRPVSQPLAIL